MVQEQFFLFRALLAGAEFSEKMTWLTCLNIANQIRNRRKKLCQVYRQGEKTSD